MELAWHEWSKDAFEKAKVEDKPILLDIHGVWCYWCHRMDKDTYKNPDVIKIINKKFIPIKVDTDERPDINSRYNVGGWPSTVFLTPDGMPIEGQTYVSPQQMAGLLTFTHTFYKENKKTLILKAPPETLYFNSTSVPAEKIATLTAGDILNYYDTLYGGFISESSQKFPMIDALEFTLAWHKKTKNKKFLDIVADTLQHMWRGAIHDKVTGGFFRYATQRDWSEPHYEKMLEDNAGLLKLCAEVFEITKNDFYKNMGEDIIKYVKKYLTNTSGGFYASQDANEEYYNCDLNDRAKRKAPRVDKTIYTNLNAKMITSYLFASKILNRKDLLDFAIKSLRNILKNCYEKNSGVAHTAERKLFGLLKDNTNSALAMIMAHECTTDRKYLENAEELAEFILKNFYDDRFGGFFDISNTRSENFGLLGFGRKDAEENAEAAIVMINLWRLTGKKYYLDSAEKTLKLLSRHVAAGTISGAPIAIASEIFLTEALNCTSDRVDELPKSISTLTCPLCRHRQKEAIPETSCQQFYKCNGCMKLVSSKDKCVFCAYGDKPCPTNC